jgi:hypothetical protein
MVKHYTSRNAFKMETQKLNPLIAKDETTRKVK